MHSGHLATLDEVVDFYDRGGDPEGSFVHDPEAPKEIVPLALNASEKHDLKTFLPTLTGDKVPAKLLKDTHRP